MTIAPPMPVVNGVPQPPDRDEQTRPARRGAAAVGMLTAFAALLFTAGWIAGVIWRVVSWIGAAVAVGFDSGRGRS